MFKRNLLFIVILSLSALFLLSCAPTTSTIQEGVEDPTSKQVEETQQEPQEELVMEKEEQQVEEEAMEKKEQEPESQSLEEQTSQSLNWRTITLNDVNSNQAFTIDQFLGKPIFLESFAVWCPKCTKQQQIFKEFHEEVGDSVISVAVGTDPNEDEARIKSHTSAHGFDWRYARAPREFTQSLIDEFGIGVVNAPSVPVVLVCEDGGVRFLQSGSKPISELKTALEEGC